ncbi:41449_t:CDS:2 [Gigaspora margarita]|uniref:41449_t:CDS:1 n=1 Tax=Gigaspora margarita TaxID=4874 RepID=A0ABN7V2X4_GIGMA|nr:41449_t:CDS:2 [Gigaspora margarita]
MRWFTIPVNEKVPQCYCDKKLEIEKTVKSSRNDKFSYLIIEQI